MREELNYSRSIAAMKPELLDEYSSDNALAFDRVSATSFEKALWICRVCGWRWSAVIKNRVSGSGCPSKECRSVKTRLKLANKLPEASLAALKPELVKLWDKEKNQLTPKQVFSQSNEKFFWLCGLGHSYQRSISSQSTSKHCPECRRLKLHKKSLIPFENSIAALYPEVAALFHHDSPIKPEQVTPGTKSKALLICAAHPEPYETTPSALIEGRACSFCSGQRVLRGFNDLATLNPEAAAEFTTNSPHRPEEVTEASSSKAIEVCCSVCGYIRITTPLEFRNKGCAACAGYVALPGFNDFGTVEPELAALVRPESQHKVSEVTIGSRKELTLSCARCGVLWHCEARRVRELLGFCGACRKSSSKLELRFQQALESQLQLLSFSTPVLQRRKPLRTESGGLLELDFWLPELQLAFEIQDFATHSRDADDELLQGRWARHAASGGGSLFKKGPTYHELKRRLAKEHLRVELIDIWEDELLDGSFKQTVSTAITHAGSRSGEPML